MTSLYSPYRAIGYVCDANPFSVNRLGEEIFVTVSIGSCFQVFRLNRLVACLVSKKAPGNISGVQVRYLLKFSFEHVALTPSLLLLQAIEHETFAAVGNNILVYDRANIVRKYEHANAVVGMISVGKTLISYDVENNIKV